MYESGKSSSSSSRRSSMCSDEHTFTDERLIGKLRRASCTGESIRSIAYWIIFYRNHASSIIRIWYDEFQNVKLDQKLTFLYIANEAMQLDLSNHPKVKTKSSSQLPPKHNPIIAKGFEEIITKAIKVIMTCGNERFIESTKKLIKIWQDRKTLHKNTMDEINYILNNISHITEEQIIATALSSSTMEPSYLSDKVVKEKEIEISNQCTISSEDNKLLKKLDHLNRNLNDASIRTDFAEENLKITKSVLAKYSNARSEYRVEKSKINNTRRSDEVCEIRWDSVDCSVYNLSPSKAQDELKEYDSALKSEKKKKDAFKESLQNVVEYLDNVISEDSNEYEEKVNKEPSNIQKQYKIVVALLEAEEKEIKTKKIHIIKTPGKEHITEKNDSRWTTGKIQTQHFATTSNNSLTIQKNKFSPMIHQRIPPLPPPASAYGDIHRNNDFYSSANSVSRYPPNKQMMAPSPKKSFNNNHHYTAETSRWDQRLPNNNDKFNNYSKNRIHSQTSSTRTLIHDSQQNTRYFQNNAQNNYPNNNKNNYNNQHNHFPHPNNGNYSKRPKINQNNAPVANNRMSHEERNHSNVVNGNIPYHKNSNTKNSMEFKQPARYF